MLNRHGYDLTFFRWNWREDVTAHDRDRGLNNRFRNFDRFFRFARENGRFNIGFAFLSDADLNPELPIEPDTHVDVRPFGVSRDDNVIRTGPDRHCSISTSVFRSIASLIFSSVRAHVHARILAHVFLCRCSTSYRANSN